jgi:hypothetical protein
MGKRNPHQVASRQEPGKGLLCYIAKLALKENKSPSIIKADLRKGMIPEKRGK